MTWEFCMRSSHRTAFRTAFLAVLAAGLLCASGCTTDEVVRQAALPATSTSATIDFHGERAGYLDASVETGGAVYRFFLPASDACRSILAAKELRYQNSGLFGRLRAGEVSCDPVGVLSLAAWRDRGPRRERPATIPRDQAVYRVYYEDQDLALARGRFRLAALVGIPAGHDLVAAIPKLPACKDVLAREVSSLEFLSSGSPAFVLVGEQGRCPVLGFAQPLPETPKRASRP
jgi:hypothetical protein